MFKIKLKLLLFEFIKTANLVKKSINKFFQECIGINKNFKPLYALGLIILKAK